MKAKIAAHSKLFKPVRDVHVNQQGNTVVHRHRSPTATCSISTMTSAPPDGCNSTPSRRLVLRRVGQPQAAQDPELLRGRRVLRGCADAEHYNAEIKAACEFHGEGFEMIACDMDAFQSIMLDGGRHVSSSNTTVYRQDRSKFLIPVLGRTVG